MWLVNSELCRSRSSREDLPENTGVNLVLTRRNSLIQMVFVSSKNDQCVGVRRQIVSEP